MNIIRSHFGIATLDIMPKRHGTQLQHAEWEVILILQLW